VSELVSKFLCQLSFDSSGWRTDSRLGSTGPANSGVDINLLSGADPIHAPQPLHGNTHSAGRVGPSILRLALTCSLSGWLLRHRRPRLPSQVLLGVNRSVRSIGGACQRLAFWLSSSRWKRLHQSVVRKP